ncbi:MAG: hypothetical protein SVK08_00805 [Halobacteriota archaeon]|nr:hypothetical protein [Halobacteriota archaeon]
MTKDEKYGKGIPIKYIIAEIDQVDWGRIVVHKQAGQIVGVEPCPFKKIYDYDKDRPPTAMDGEWIAKGDKE